MNLYAPANGLTEFLEWNKYQVFETDRVSWRKPLIGADDMVLLVLDPTFNGLTVKRGSCG